MRRARAELSNMDVTGETPPYVVAVLSKRLRYAARLTWIEAPMASAFVTYIA